MQEQSIALAYREGSSDKVYNATLSSKAGGYVVEFAYGRRGAALTAGTKTSQPVDYARAKKIFDAVVSEKTAKGYTASGEGATPFAGTDNAKRVSGLLPQLLNEVDSEAEVEQLLRDDAWCAQEKQDGERRLATYTRDTATGVNRKGLTVALPQAIADGLIDLASRTPTNASTELDGEQIGETFVIFDALRVNGTDLRGRSVDERLIALKALFAGQPSWLAVIETAYTEADKRALLARVIAEQGEGIVFKRRASAYVPGRPNSGGDQRKFPLKATATVRVLPGREGKRSVGIEVIDIDTGLWVFVGNVTIPPNFKVPAAGEIVSIRYLYAYPNGGSLFQPQYLGPRSDQDASDCVRSQLKYKPEPKAN